MSALSNLPLEAQQACVALAASTVWPAEEWAIATQRLIRGNMPMDEMGMTRLIQITLAVRQPPSEVAALMVQEYQKVAETKQPLQGLQSL